MIEEINKLTTYEIESEVIIGNKHYVSNIKTINLESVIEILDKYKNQETFLNERIDTLKDTQLKQLNIISKLEKYKNAWEELKEYITKENIPIQGVEVLEQEDLIDKMQELEQKHNIERTGGKE